jgi:hypothetical protein
MHRVPQGFVTVVEAQLIVLDGASTVYKKPIPNGTFDKFLLIDDNCLLLMRSEIYHSKLFKTGWNLVRTLKYGDIEIIGKKFFLLDEEKIYFSTDGLVWSYLLTYGLDYFDLRGEICFLSYDKGWTRDGVNWLTLPEDHDYLWYDDRNVVIKRPEGTEINGTIYSVRLDGIFIWQGRPVGYNNTEFFTEGKSYPHSLGRIVNVVANDSHVFVNNGDLAVTSDLIKWKTYSIWINDMYSIDDYIVLDRNNFGRHHIGIYVTPIWKVRTIATALPVDKKLFRKILLAFLRRRMNLVAFLDVVAFVNML